MFAKFITVPDGRPDRYLPLHNASTDRGGPPPESRIDFSKIELEKVALTADSLPPGASLRAEANKGKIVRVDGKVARGPRLAVEFLGETYDVWSFDPKLRAELRGAHRAGQPFRFYGELGQYKERWQFVIQDASWVK